MKKIIISTTILVIALSSFKSINQPGGIKASMQRGQKVYQLSCLACHQADGLGVQRMNPPIVKTKWVLGNKNALIKIVLNGLKCGEIVIDGDNFHNPMPPQATLLTDQQIADVLTFVRNSFGNKATVVTPAEVKAARSPKKTIAIKSVKKTAKH